jgi:ribonuclease P protein component
MKEFGLPKEFRLRRRSDFVSRWRGVRRIKTRHFTMICRKGIEGGPRLGIVASRKVGNAVRRNRVKRLVREFFRLNRGKMPWSEDVIVIARPMSHGIKYKDVEGELKSLL